MYIFISCSLLLSRWLLLLFLLSWHFVLMKIQEAMEEHGVLVRVLNLSDREDIKRAHVHAMLLFLELINGNLSVVDSQEVIQCFVLLDVEVGSLDIVAQFGNTLLLSR